MRSFEVRAASSQHETGTGIRLVNPWFDWLLEVKPKNRKVCAKSLSPGGQ
jgi:hypothetical protein